MRAVALSVMLLSVAARAEGKPEGLLLGLRDKQGRLSTWFVDGKKAERLGDGLALPARRGWMKLLIVGDAADFWVGKPREKPPPPKAADVGCEAKSSATVLFASGDFIGIGQTMALSCEGAAHPTAEESLAMRATPGDAKSAAAIAAVLGDGASTAFAAAWRKARAASDQPDCLAEDPEPTAWSLAHKSGRWIVRGLIGRTSEACRGQELPFEVQDAPADARVSGSAPVDVESGDAVPSPSGAFVVTVGSGAVRVLAGKKESARAAAEGEIVLTQWALGKSVERWRREARATLAK